MAKKAATIKNWDDFNADMHDMARLESRMAYLNNELAGLRATRDEIKQRLEEFVLKHRADLGALGSKTLESGKVSISSKPVVRFADWESTLDYLQKHRLEECFKVDYKPVKSAFNGLDAEVLEAAGVSFEASDAVTFKAVPVEPRMAIQYQ